MKQLKRSDFWLPLLCALSCALALWFLWGLVGVRFIADYWFSPLTTNFESVDLAALGQAGDLFGGINALFAAFAFAGVALAAFYQYETWKLQTVQTQMARSEHIQQSFEPLFFKLLERLDSVSEKARRDVLNYWEPVVNNGYRAYRYSGAQCEPHRFEYKQEVIHSFLEVYEASSTTLAPYFRSLYQVFKFIANSELTPSQKILYANIARANLSEAEVTMLGFNGMTSEGSDFHHLVEAFGLLKHVKDPDALEIFRAYYSHTAFLSSRCRLDYWHSEGKSHLPYFLMEPQE